jgi:hypothetical protein
MLSQNEMRCVQAPLYTKAKLTPLTCFFNINTDACRSNIRIEGTVTPKRREDELGNLKLYFLIVASILYCVGWGKQIGWKLALSAM